MKELSIEEKAKAYDEALERAKGVIEQNPLMEYLKKAIEYIFPELKESEDERIRKAIHIYLDWLDGKKDYAPRGEYTINDMIAWLEEQGQHKKFRDSIQVGDKVTRNKDGVLVNLSQLNRVAKKDEKQGEQKDILKDAILDDNEDGLIAETIRCKKEKPCEQKSVWSEYDEEIHRKCICAMRASACGFPEEEKFVEQVDNWLKSLKDRVQPKQEWSEDGEAFYNKTIGLLKQYASDNEVREQSAMSCINWLKSAIKHEKIAKYKIGDRVRFYSDGLVFTISDIDEVNERYISTSGDSISFYEELISAKSSLNKDDIKCGDYLTTKDGIVIKVHDVDENDCIHYFYYASELTENGGDISNDFMCYCAILSDCHRATQEEINFLEKWVAHKKYVWVEDNVSPYDEEED